MDTIESLRGLVSVGPRGACSGGERRAATWARDELRARGHDAHLETIWVRPAWAASLALHMVLAVAGSLISVWQAEVGLAVLGLTAISLAGELTGRLRILRLPMPLRATQNVVVEASTGVESARLLVITANLDAGPAGATSADRWRAFDARLRRTLRGYLPGPFALVWAAIVVLALLAGLRVDGQSGQALAAIQFALTVIVVIAFAALIDIALAEVSPGANVNASGVTAAIGLTDELRRGTVAGFAVELVLSGAGDRQALGLEHYLRSRRRHRSPRDVVVLSIEPCGGGRPVWLERDGPLIPLRMHPRLCQLMAAAASGERHLGARPERGWGTSAAHVARRLGWPAVAVGALDDRGVVPRGHQADDTADAIDPSTIAAVLELCLAFAGALDDELQAIGRPAGVTRPDLGASPVPGGTAAARD